MKKYFLACTCGQQAEVDSSQAGLTIKCPCGADLEVPTMRGLAQLPVVEAQPASTAAETPAWGPGQGLMFLGIVIALCGLIALGLVLPTRPQWKVPMEQIAVQVEGMPVEHLWAHWQELRKGLTSGDDPIRQQFEAEWATYRRRLTMAIIPLALGVLMAIGGFLLKGSQRAVRAAS